MTGPRIRIVHPGGSAVHAQVWLGDQQLHCVTRVEISPLDVDGGLVTAALTVIDPELAIEADLAESTVREVPQLPADPTVD